MHYVKHLSGDDRLKPLIRQFGAFRLTKKKSPWLHLCYSIMGQQLSTKVADIIQQRFLNLYDTEPSAQQVVDTPLEKLRSIGLSHAKVKYVQNVARFEIEHGINHKKLAKMSNEEVIAYLTQIKGVGRWTAEMLLMFTLAREDVFAPADLGLQQAMVRLYNLKHRKKKTLQAAINTISGRWSPYRTYACLYLWRWKDNTPATQPKK